MLAVHTKSELAELTVLAMMCAAELDEAESTSVITISSVHGTSKATISAQSFQFPLSINNQNG